MSALIGTPNTLSIYSAQSQKNVASVTAAASTSQTMMGIAASITPVLSGRVLITITADVGNATIGDGDKFQISYGTGTAPSNAAAVTGTQVGPNVQFIAATVAGRSPLSITAVVTGLTVNTAYWVDLASQQVTGGTGTLENIGVSIIEF